MKKRIAAVVLLAALLAAVMSVSAIALAEKTQYRLETHTYWAGAPAAYTVFTENMPDDAKLVSIKSSKPKVLKVEKWGSGCWDSAVVPLKPGKSKVTVVYKVNKKKVTVSGTYTVKKYPNAIKKLLVNKKPVDLKANKFEVDCKKLKSAKVTLKVTPASGWKVSNPIEILSEGCSYKTVKNGKTVKISLKKPRVSALITLTNKLGEEFEYFVELTE